LARTQRVVKKTFEMCVRDYVTVRRASRQKLALPPGWALNMRRTHGGL
jgi:hypothetical protein